MLNIILAGGSLVRNVFYQPYFMLYGEVYAPDIDPKCNASMYLRFTYLLKYLININSFIIRGQYYRDVDLLHFSEDPDFEPLKLFNVDFNADPDLAFQ
jgi:hypothetical protein